MFDLKEASEIINISVAQRSPRGSSDTPEDRGRGKSQCRLGWGEGGDR